MFHKNADAAAFAEKEPPRLDLMVELILQRAGGSSADEDEGNAHKSTRAEDECDRAGFGAVT